MPIVDLHAHTTFSDGTSSPSEVVYAYKKAGVQIMSITDHDTLEALPQAEVLAKNAGILFVPGVEISSREHDHLHILGYNIDPQNKILQEALALNREKRNIRAKKIIKQNKVQNIWIFLFLTHKKTFVTNNKQKGNFYEKKDIVCCNFIIYILSMFFWWKL